MNNLCLKKLCAIVLAAYAVVVAGFFLIAKDQLRYQDSVRETVNPSQPIGEIIAGSQLRQRFTAKADMILDVSMTLSTYNRTNSSHLAVSIQDENGTVLAHESIPTEDLVDNSKYTVHFAQPAELQVGNTYYLILESPDAAYGNAVTAWFGNSVAVAKMEIEKEIPAEDKLTLDGVALDGMLSFQFTERTLLWSGKIYWHAAGLLAALLVVYELYLLRAVKRGVFPLTVRVLEAFRKYSFLIRQLVSRDFKTKYKRSVMGIFWSFLNPLLTMLVQYIVFSTLFNSDIPNFPLYLLTGIVCFNFFSEATSMCLQSIVGNASLITKVYVPKYIYPVTRVLSSAINLLLSMIPLLGVVLLTQTPIRPAMFLLPFAVVCLVTFCLGMGFILSAMMVFFRDTQFLWGVLSMLWMYATPIFYPESIIPERFMLLYKCNPLYHIIRFFRIVLLNGVSPEPKAYALCLVAAVVPLLLGTLIFKKCQDKFILNL